MSRRQISLEQFQAECLGQGVPWEHVALICPMCKTVQSATDLIRSGAGADLDAVQKFLGFSCVGRFTGQGPPTKAQKGRGCNWTLGGLFAFHELEVITPDGTAHPRFELATPEQAQAHRSEGGLS